MNFTPEEQLRIYEGDTNAERNIRDAITDAYNNLKPESEAVRTYESQQFPAFYDAFHGYGAGGGASDMSPTALLGNAWRNVGQKSATAQVARDVFNTRQAGMEDLISQAYRQWQHGYAGAQSGHDRWWREQQAEEDRRRWEEQMALERERMARMGSGTGAFNWSPPPQGAVDEQWKVDAYNAWLADQQKKIQIQNAAYNAPADRAHAAQQQISGYATPAPPAPNTSSDDFNRFVNNFRGIE